MRWLWVGVFGALSIVAISGVLLPASPRLWLGIHLCSAAISSATISALVGRHWWARRRLVSHHPNTSWGYALLSQLVGLGLSGVLLLAFTNFQPLRSLHTGLALASTLPLIIHGLWRVRHKRWRHQRWSLPRMGMPVLLTTAGCVAFAFVLSVNSARATTIAHSRPPGPSQVLVHNGLGMAHLATAKDCNGCHSDLVAQWQTSAHANAATDTYYLAVAGLLIQERGIEAVRYCATCHNPVGLMQGEIDRSAARPGGQSTAAYTARSLGLSLGISDRAAEGVTCTICHRASDVAAHPLNGSLALTAARLVLPSDPLSQFVLRVAPAPHAAELMPPIIREAALCGSCHNLYLPASGDTPELAVEPTFDEWLNSSYPARGITCQTCHMPSGLARSVDSDLPASTATHGGQPGSPSSLPLLAKDTGLLTTAANLTVRLDSGAPEYLLATVTITNSGTGHYLPTGAADLRQVWLEASLDDSVGQRVWQSGVLDQYGQLNSDAVQFRKVLGDSAGRPIDLHRIWVTTHTLEDTRLAPEETRQIVYRIDLSQAGRGPYTLRVRLRYQDVSQVFAEFALGRPAPDLPIYDMAIATAVSN